jgi:hypothetical protein
MPKESVFTVKLETDLRDAFMAEAAATAVRFRSWHALKGRAVDARIKSAHDVYVLNSTFYRRGRT